MSPGAEGAAELYPVPGREDLANVPTELCQRPQWVVWKLERRGEKWTKVPYTPGSEGRASATDMMSWRSFGEALKALHTGRTMRGVGYMFSSGDPYVGVDLDECRDPVSRELEPWAAEIVRRLGGYAEASPSGTGVHIIVRGRVARARRTDGIEVYGAERYFTMSGYAFGALPGRIPKSQEGLDWLLAHHLPEISESNGSARPAGEPVELDDRHVLDLCRKASNSLKFENLWSGDTSGYGGDHSRADEALVSLIAFYTQDADQLDRLFRQSGLMRRKWEQRSDYRRRTIDFALRSQREHYRNRRTTRPRPGPEHESVSAMKPAGNGRAPDAEAGKAPGDPRFNLTDLGNAERLVARHGREIRYCHARQKWYTWTGRHWAEDATGRVRHMARETVRGIGTEASRAEDAEERKKLLKWALSSESKTRIDAMVGLAEVEEGVPVKLEELDADPWKLNCLNGTVDLRTGELREHRREDLLTKTAPVTFDPDSRSEDWERLLKAATGGDEQLAAFLQRAVGYSLTGDISEEVLFFVHGPAAAGKSTYLEALKTALGDYATTADFEVFLARRDVGGPRNDIARLAGSRFVCSVEVDEGKRLAQGLIKMLTGGDKVSARFLYREAFEFLPTFKLWLAANHAPKVRDDDEAMWRRILRVPFEHVIPKHERDPSLKKRLQDMETSGPAILAWAVRGCLAWQREGLGVPPAVERATEEYREGQDPLRDFLAECCVVGEGVWSYTGDLREAYERWAQDNGERHLVKGREWGERLKAHGGVADKVTGGRRIWRNIALISGPDDDPDSKVADSATDQKPRKSQENSELVAESGEDFSKVGLENYPSRGVTENAATIRHSATTDRSEGDERSADGAREAILRIFSSPPDWLRRQVEQHLEDAGERTLKPLCSSVASELFGDHLRGHEVRPFVEEQLAGWSRAPSQILDGDSDGEEDPEDWDELRHLFGDEEDPR